MGKIPHIVQYQGSKRIIAPKILKFMPHQFSRLIEPFSGMAAISMAVAQERRSKEFILNDLNAELIAVLETAINQPNILMQAYERLWKEQFIHPEGHEEHFYQARKKFNQGDQPPEYMLYLLARCVKGSVRYGKNGNFNQSPDKRRHGTNPTNMAKNIAGASQLLHEKASFFSKDYQEILQMAKPGDLIYMDPPYQGVCSTRDSRYFAGIVFDEFVVALEGLNAKGIDFLVSYDGTTGEQRFGKDLPQALNCKKVMIQAGVSTQATLLGKKAITQEALYISESLLQKLIEQDAKLALLEVV